MLIPTLIMAAARRHYTLINSTSCLALEILVRMDREQDLGHDILPFEEKTEEVVKTMRDICTLWNFLKHFIFDPCSMK